MPRLEARINEEVKCAIEYIRKRRGGISATTAVVLAILDYAERLGWKRGKTR